MDLITKVDTICRNCAREKGGRDIDIEAEDFWEGVCGLCHQDAAVTQPWRFDYIYPERKVHLAYPERQRVA